MARGTRKAPSPRTRKRRRGSWLKWMRRACSRTPQHGSPTAIVTALARSWASATANYTRAAPWDSRGSRPTSSNYSATGIRWPNTPRVRRNSRIGHFSRSFTASLALNPGESQKTYGRKNRNCASRRSIWCAAEADLDVVLTLGEGQQHLRGFGREAGPSRPAIHVNFPRRITDQSQRQRHRLRCFNPEKLPFAGPFL